MVGGGDPFYMKFWVNWPPLERNRRFSTDIYIYKCKWPHFSRRNDVIGDTSKLMSSDAFMARYTSRLKAEKYFDNIYAWWITSKSKTKHYIIIVQEVSTVTRLRLPDADAAVTLWIHCRIDHRVACCMLCQCLYRAWSQPPRFPMPT